MLTNQLSALFELADEQIDLLRKERNAYRDSLRGVASGNNGFDMDAELNIDSLASYLEYTFGDRDAEEHPGGLLEDILAAGVTLRDIQAGYEQLRDILPSHEAEIQRRWGFGDGVVEGGSGYGFNREGVVRHILDLTHDDWWAIRRSALQPDSVDEIEAQRQRLK